MARVRVLEHLHGRVSPSIASLLPTLSEDDNPLIAQVALSPRMIQKHWGRKYEVVAA